MIKLRTKLANSIFNFSQSEGFQATPVPGVHCIKISETSRRSKRRWHSSLAIVAQGCKEVVLEKNVFRCEEMHYTATPVDLPVISRIASATSQHPFLCLLIEFDPLIFNEVALQLEKEAYEEPDEPLQALFVGHVNDKMMEAAMRLIALFEKPADARVLGPLIIREMFYYLLTGPDGPAIRQFARSGSITHKIAKAMFHLKSEFAMPLGILRLAKTANMSRSAFFKHFKAMTGLSPIQYQKRFRLLEAKRLMTEESETAENSAFKVGYSSASQFSREYSRMFGNPPLRDAVKLREKASPRKKVLDVEIEDYA